MQSPHSALSRNQGTSGKDGRTWSRWSPNLITELDTSYSYSVEYLGVSVRTFFHFGHLKSHVSAIINDSSMGVSNPYF